ncbi:MAG: VOC family protein [Candidatus Eisenbacteria bacterium]
MLAKVRTCLWFDGDGEDAAKFYVSLLPNSEITTTFRPNPDAPPVLVEFRLAGTPYQALNGGPHFKHSEAASISVITQDQEESDRLWDALTSDGGQESMCGWLKDRFGVSWQIVPEPVTQMISSPDTEAAGRAMQTLLEMKRLNIAEIQAAFEGK